MKLGICVYPLSKGIETGRGLERVIQEFYNYLSKNNIDFDFYDKGIIRNEIKAILQSFQYLKSLNKTHNDCYFAFYPVAGIFPIFNKKRPVVLGVYDMIPFHVHGFDNRIKYAIKRFCIRYTCKRSDYIIVPFLSTKNEIIEKFKVNSNNIFVVPIGVNHQNYYPENSIIKDPLKIAFLGEAKRAKGLDSLIAAFKLVLEKIPNAKLEIASNGNELKKMQKLAIDTLPGNSYVFRGFIEENKMRKFYNSVGIFVFPSRYGFGLSALEAMACGTPSIIGDTLDSTEFITDNDLLVDPENVQDIAEKIIILLTNSSKYKEKQINAIEIAKKYSWDIMSEKYLEICNNSKIKYSQYPPK